MLRPYYAVGGVGSPREDYRNATEDVVRGGITRTEYSGFEMPGGLVKTNRGYGFAYFFNRIGIGQLDIGPTYQLPVCYDGTGGGSFFNVWWPLVVRRDITQAANISYYGDGKTSVPTNYAQASAALNVMCYAPVSDIFETPISVLNPKMPVVEFLDAGDIVFKVHLVNDGYTEEGGSYGGHAGFFCQTGTASTKFILTHIHGASETTLNEDASDLMTADYTAYSLSVAPGDQITLQIKYPAGGSAGQYSLLHYSNTFAGWKNADEP